VAVQRARQARRPARSQHFLRDRSVAEELTTLAGVSRGDLVLEIGAGDGAITSALARRAGYVIAHEIDPLLAVRLRERFGPLSSVLVVEGDAFAQPVPRVPFRAVSNVPFHETTRLFRLLLDDPRVALERAALIVQWEVARKRARGNTLLGLGWAPWWEIRLVRQLPATAFRPRPSVDAGIVVISRRAEPLLPGAQAKAYRAFLRRNFGHRRRPADLDEWLRLFRSRR
jgi:23S rRNA (adenine-N6)-dimethyltransferase